MMNKGYTLRGSFQKLGSLFNISYYAFLCIYSIAHAFLGKGKLGTLVVAPIFYQAVLLFLIILILLLISYVGEKYYKDERFKQERSQFIPLFLINFTLLGIFLRWVFDLDPRDQPFLFQKWDMLFLAISGFIIFFAPLISGSQRPTQHSSILRWWTEISKKIIQWNTYLIVNVYKTQFGITLVVILLFFFCPFVLLPLIWIAESEIKTVSIFLGIAYGVFAVNSYRWYVHQGIMPTPRSK